MTLNFPLLAISTLATSTYRRHQPPPFVPTPLLQTDASLVNTGDRPVFKLEVGGAEIWLLNDESD